MSLEDRITELENKFKNHTHGSNGKEIAELRNQIQNNSVADLNHYNELKENITIVADSSGNFEDMLLSKIINLKEVLRIIIKDVSYPWFTEYEKKNLLSLLDAPQTEKKELYKCDECEYYNGTSGCWAIKGLYDQTHPKCTFKRKDSGGEE